MVLESRIQVQAAVQDRSAATKSPPPRDLPSGVPWAYFAFLLGRRCGRGVVGNWRIRTECLSKYYVIWNKLMFVFYLGRTTFEFQQS